MLKLLSGRKDKMITLCNMNFLTGVSFLLVITLTRLTAFSTWGWMVLDANQLVPLTEWSFMNTAVIKILEQCFIKGIPVVGFLIQYRERIVAIITALLSAKFRMVNRILEMIYTLPRFEYCDRVVLFFHQIGLLIEGKISENITFKSLHWYHWRQVAEVTPGVPCSDLVLKPFSVDSVFKP
jgi:hypothetical protein